MKINEVKARKALEVIVKECQEEFDPQTGQGYDPREVLTELYDWDFHAAERDTGEAISHREDVITEKFEWLRDDLDEALGLDEDDDADEKFCKYAWPEIKRLMGWS